MPKNKRNTFPDTTRPGAMPSNGDPSSTDPSSADPSAATAPPPSEPSPTPGERAAADAALLASTPAENNVPPAPAVEVDPTKPSVMSVFKELAKCADLAALCKHVEANPAILDFLSSRRGILPCYSDKPPPTFPAPGQLRSYDDYVDVLFTRGGDGTWTNTKLSR